MKFISHVLFAYSLSFWKELPDVDAFCLLVMKTFWIHWWGCFPNVLSNHLSFFKYLLKMDAQFNCVFSVLGSAYSFSVSFELSSQEASLEISHRIPVFICVISLQHVCVVQPGQTRLWGHSQNGRLLFASSCWLMSIIYCWEFRDIIGFISCFPQGQF